MASYQTISGLGGNMTPSLTGAGYDPMLGFSMTPGDDERKRLKAEYQASFEAAKKANESRYNEILGGYRSRRDRALGDLSGSGTQERKDIDRRWNDEKAAERQNMVNRGLSASTILSGVEQGVEERRSDDIGRLEERLRQQRIGLDTGLDLDTLQFMERRTDAYPDYNLLAKLSEGIGQGGGGLQVTQGGGGPGYGKKNNSDLRTSGATERRPMPQQGAGESKEAFEARKQKAWEWEYRNVPQSQQVYGNKEYDFNNLQSAAEYSLAQPGRQPGSVYTPKGPPSYLAEQAEREAFQKEWNDQYLRRPTNRAPSGERELAQDIKGAGYGGGVAGGSGTPSIPRMSRRYQPYGTGGTGAFAPPMYEYSGTGSQYGLGMSSGLGQSYNKRPQFGNM